MSDLEVQIGDIIFLTTSRIPALVLTKTFDTLVVAFEQDPYNVIEDEVVWKQGRWELRYTGPSGKKLRGAEVEQIRRRLRS